MRIKTGKSGILVVAWLCLPISGRALDVLPDFFQLKGLPGARLKASLQIVNDSSSVVDVRLDLQGVGAVGKKPWITVSPEKMKIPAGKSHTAYLAVRVPPSGGECQAEVRARTAGPLAVSEVRVVRKVNLIILGTEKYAVSLTSSRVLRQGDSVSVEADFRNEGNVTLRPKLGAVLSFADGSRSSAYQEGPAVAVAPGAEGAARVLVPLSGRRWDGAGTVTVYYLDTAGKTRSVEGKIGD